MNKKSYVQPVSDVLDIYTDEFMEGGFRVSPKTQLQTYFS